MIGCAEIVHFKSMENTQANYVMYYIPGQRFYNYVSILIKLFQYIIINLSFLLFDYLFGSFRYSSRYIFYRYKNIFDNNRYRNLINFYNSNLKLNFYY